LLISRLAKLDYVFDTEEAMGPKGKSPWITINGQEIADSQLIIDFLCEKFDLDVGRGLSASDRAVARAWQVLLDERFFWCMALDRFIYTDRNHFDNWFR
jgi:glutathione S-transferase